MCALEKDAHDDLWHLLNNGPKLDSIFSERKLRRDGSNITMHGNPSHPTLQCTVYDKFYVECRRRQIIEVGLTGGMDGSDGVDSNS